MTADSRSSGQRAPVPQNDATQEVGDDPHGYGQWRIAEKDGQPAIDHATDEDWTAHSITRERVALWATMLGLLPAAPVVPPAVPGAYTGLPCVNPECKRIRVLRDTMRCEKCETLNPAQSAGPTPFATLAEFEAAWDTKAMYEVGFDNRNAAVILGRAAATIRDLFAAASPAVAPAPPREELEKAIRDIQDEAAVGDEALRNGMKLTRTIDRLYAALASPAPALLPVHWVRWAVLSPDGVPRKFCDTEGAACEYACGDEEVQQVRLFPVDSPAPSGTDWPQENGIAGIRVSTDAGAPDWVADGIVEAAADRTEGTP